MGKGPKLRLSFLNSIQICRPNDPSTLINPSLTCTNNSISLPTFPEPQSKPKDKQRLLHQPNKPKAAQIKKDDETDDHGCSNPSKTEGPRRRFKRYGSKDWIDKVEEKKPAASRRMVDGESYVVVKRSTDPYKDFKKSMLEMILERQMFEPKEMEQLLMSFVSLNSRMHHKAILKAFSEIWREVYSPH